MANPNSPNSSSSKSENRSSESRKSPKTPDSFANIGEINRSHQMSEPTHRGESRSSESRSFEGSTSGMSSDRSSSMNMNADELRQNMDRISGEIRDRASRMAKDVSERARVYYGDSSVWLQDNYGKALAVVGILAAAGMVGYFMARRNSEDMNSSMESKRA